MAATLLDTHNVRQGVKLDDAYMGALLATEPKAAYFYINADTHDAENVANGSLTIHSRDAVVHPEHLPQNMFEYIVAVPIRDVSSKPSGWKDADFEGKLGLLNEAVQQYSINPPTLETRDKNNNADGDIWTPELGQMGAFAGIFKQMRSNQRDANYYVVVKSGAELAAQQLRQELIADGKEMTYGKLLADDRVAYVNAVSLRNCNRIAYNIAKALQLEIPRVQDVSAYSPTEFTAKPYRAEPTEVRHGVLTGIQQSVSTVKPVSFKGEESVGIFHKVRPIVEARKQNLVIGNPYDGLHVFHMDNQPLGFALPADTGLAKSLDAADLKHAQTSKRHENVCWDGPHDALKALAHDVNHAVDEEFFRGMHQAGWQQKGKNTVSQMVPVLLKVSNADLKRN